MDKRMPEDFAELPPRVSGLHEILLADFPLRNVVARCDLNGKGMHGHVIISETVELIWMFRSFNRSIRGPAGTQYSGGITPRAETDPSASIAAMTVVGNAVVRIIAVMPLVSSK